MGAQYGTVALINRLLVLVVSKLLQRAAEAQVTLSSNFEPKELETFEHAKSTAALWSGEAASVSGGTVPPETPTIETFEAAGPPSMPGEAASGSDGETKADDAEEDPEAEPTGNDSDGEEEIDELALCGDKVVPCKCARVAAPVRRGLLLYYSSVDARAALGLETHIEEDKGDSVEGG